MHGLYIERPAMPGHQLTEQRGAHLAVDHDIAIAARHGAEPRVKIGRHGLRPVHSYIVGKCPIDAEDPCLGGALCGSIKMHNLAMCVHTGISAAGAVNAHRRSGNRGQS